MLREFQYFLPTRIVYGIGSIKKVPEEIKRLGGTKAFVVTDQGIRNAGLLNQIEDHLKAASLSYVVFDGVEPDAKATLVDRETKNLREAKCDIIVALGGGSVLCVSKAVAAIATNGGSICDYEGFEKLTNPPLPVIAIPTTAGSGSEVSKAFPVVDDRRDHKMAIQSSLSYPPVALLDPALLQGLPFRQAAYSGADAFTHAVEAYLSTQASPLTDALALQAIKLLSAYLVPACMGDLEAKGYTLLGSTIANMACGHATVGLVHAMSRPITEMYHLPYGMIIGILLPYVMEYNCPACLERFATIATTMGKLPRGPVRDLAWEGVRAIKELLADLEFPMAFKKEEVDCSQIPTMAKIAIDTHMARCNCRRPSLEDLVRLYEASFKGWTL